MPPMPEPMITPDAVTVLLGHVEARVLHRLLRRHKAEMGVAVVAPRLLRVHVRVASQSRTSAPIWQAKSVGSKCVIRPTPALPASKLAQNASTSWPRPWTTPMPVMTTRRKELLNVSMAAVQTQAD